MIYYEHMSAPYKNPRGDFRWESLVKAEFSLRETKSHAFVLLSLDFYLKIKSH